MHNKGDVERLEKLIGQLSGLHTEISPLVRKSPNDGVNGFKLKLINKIIVDANAVLGVDYRPLEEFESFEIEDVPSNSDVAMVVGQYIEAAERFRSDNIKSSYSSWYYVLDGEISDIRTAPPAKIGKK